MKTRLAALDVNHKLRVIQVAATGAAFLLATLVLAVHLWWSERDVLLHNGEVTARMTARNCTAAVLFGDAKTASELIGTLVLDGDVIGADLLGSDGQRFASYRRADAGDPASAVTGFAAALADHFAAHFHLRYLDVAAPVVADGRTIGMFHMRVDLASAYGRLAISAAILLAASITAIFLAVLLLKRLQRVIVEPLSRLLATMRLVSDSGDYAQRAEVVTTDEIGALGDGFNHMIAQIEQRDAALERELAERRRAEHGMREALVVFNTSSQGIVTTDAERIVTAVNPAYTAITGFAADEVVGRGVSLARAERQPYACYKAIRTALLAAGRWEGEIRSRRKNGEVYPAWLTITAVRDQTGRIVEYVSMFSDITERKRQEQMIWDQANFDALTGLANRHLFHERLERAIVHAQRSGRKLGLMFLDLDGFKWTNDTLGHHVGDELLVEVARRLQDCLREEDTVARLGGDEFTMVINDLADPEDLRAIAEKMIGVLREPFALGGGSQHVSGSVGIAVYPDDGDDLQTLLKHADIAMYNSKQAGKNRFQFYAQHMQSDAQARVRTEAELRVAIQRQEFVLYYQPVVDAVSGVLVGAEALIRWQHPVRGLVAPLEFIPVAEDCGLVAEIGAWVFREAARQCRRWQEAGLPALRLAVNVSPLQFREPGLPDMIAALLDEYRVDQGRLMIEITESVLMDGSDAIEQRMESVRKLGIGFALDDFGTGYSSLSYLKRFPVDVVKIDRGFVSDCTENPGDAKLVEAIINMAHGLGMRVTAEGVETAAQLNFLRKQNCDFIQGYLIGRPVPAAEFEQLTGRHPLFAPTIRRVHSANTHLARYSS